MKSTLFTALLSLIMSFASAQSVQRCGTELYHAEMMQKNPDYALSYQSMQRQVNEHLKNQPAVSLQGTINIPVVFHVIYSNAAQNISSVQILENLNVLNQDFNRQNPDTGNTPAPFQSCAANVGINFCLATQDPNGQPTTGILSVPTTVSSFSTNNSVKFTAQGGHDAWPASQYLNIWVCNMGGGMLGYATFPGGPAATDGIVAHYATIGGPNAPGTNSPYNLGRNLTHEAGHYLNLPHFNLNCDPTNTNGCHPPQQNLNVNCPSFPSITCNNGPNGDQFMNFMQFVDDNCMNMFNVGQAARMSITMNGSRSSLSSSLGCVPVGINEINALNDFSIMPNPFSDFINIETRNSSEVEVRMFDISGRMVLSERFTHKIALNTQTLAKGFYNLELIFNGQKKLEKVIKN